MKYPSFLTLFEEMYDGVHSYDGNIHEVDDDIIGCIQAHELTFECWCVPEYIGKELGTKVFRHRIIQ